jgi:hypothetical protein
MTDQVVLRAAYELDVGQIFLHQRPECNQPSAYVVVRVDPEFNSGKHVYSSLIVRSLVTGRDSWYPLRSTTEVVVVGLASNSKITGT